MVPGLDDDFIPVEIDGIGPYLFAVPGGVVDIQDFSVIVVHLIIEGRLRGGRMGMAGNPEFHLGICEEQEVNGPCGLGKVPGASYFVVVGNEGIRERSVVKDNGGLRLVFFQRL